MNDKLFNSVKRRIGSGWRETLRNVAAHGADCGFPGFTFYNETRSFYLSHRKDINDALVEVADECGVNFLEMVQVFGCVGKDFSLIEIAQSMYGPANGVDDQIANALAWFALEEAAAYYDSLQS